MDRFTVVDIKSGYEVGPATAIQTAAYEHIYSEIAKDGQKGELSFSDDGHIYRLNGVIIPSVTKILKDEGLIDLAGIPSNRLDAACRFGTAVHKACELYDLDDLVEESLNPALRPYLDGWIAFVRDIGLEFIAIEQPIASSVYRVAGTPDRIARSDKSRRLSVLLNNEGTYKIKEYTDKADWQVFLAALTVNNWKGREK